MSSEKSIETLNAELSRAVNEHCWVVKNYTETGLLDSDTGQQEASRYARKIQRLIKRGANLNTINKDRNNTTLLKSIKNNVTLFDNLLIFGEPDFVRALMKQGAKASSQAILDTCLKRRLLCRETPYNFDTSELLKFGANPNIRIRDPKTNTKTPAIEWAIRTNKPVPAVVLFRYGASLPDLTMPNLNKASKAVLFELHTHHHLKQISASFAGWTEAGPITYEACAQALATGFFDFSEEAKLKKILMEKIDAYTNTLQNKPVDPLMLLAIIRTFDAFYAEQIDANPGLQRIMMQFNAHAKPPLAAKAAEEKADIPQDDQLTDADRKHLQAQQQEAERMNSNLMIFEQMRQQPVQAAMPTPEAKETEDKPKAFSWWGRKTPTQTQPPTQNLNRIALNSGQEEVDVAHVNLGREEIGYDSDDGGLQIS